MIKIECNVCGSKAIITRTERMTEDHSYSRLYCSCKNKACNHRFVMNLEFSHSINTGLLEKDKLIIALIERLSEKEKKALLNSLQNG